MPAVTLLRQEAAPDALDNARFELYLGQVPGDRDTINFTLAINNTSYPGWGNEVWDNPANAHVRRFRGRKTYPRTITVTYSEFVTFENTNMLRAWNEFIVGTYSGNSSGYKKDYSANTDLVIYDVTCAETEDTTFWYMFPTDLGDVAVSGEASAAWQGTATFSYDFTTSSNVTPL